jgi:predicted Rossmann fold flavoprotein
MRSNSHDYKLSDLNKQKYFDVVVIGSGAAGMMSAIIAARRGNKVLVLEKLPKIGAKLKATGGGRCNLTNTLNSDDFMERFGRNGRFMQEALNLFDHDKLIEFFAKLGVMTHAPDGYRVFPITHQSTSIISALEKEMLKQNIQIHCSSSVKKIDIDTQDTKTISTNTNKYITKNIIIATGGMGYSSLGADGDGYNFAKSLGHSISDISPAMMPLHVSETWVQNCRADTMPKVTIKVDLPKHNKLKAKGDLIFTKNGIRGPVVLDFARDITPLLKKYNEVPILINLTKGMNEEQIRIYIKNQAIKNPNKTILEHIHTLLPLAISKELCTLSQINFLDKLSIISGFKRDKLIKLLAWTPLHVNGHDGFKKAMITRGGVTLREINPKTMQSKLVKGVYFCGEVVDLDGPCGGYNLQWSFSSGYLAGLLL